MANPMTAKDHDSSNAASKITPSAVYRESLAYAREHDELGMYVADRNKTIECRDAINDAIEKSRYDTHSYNMKDAAKQVIDAFGSERVELIMAKLVQNADWDGRYSRQNKDWAKGIEIPQSMNDVYSNTHPCLLDGFLTRVCEKSAILDKLKQQPHHQGHKKPVPAKKAEVDR